MEAQLISYFAGEKWGGLGFMVAGVAAVLASAALLRTQTFRWRRGYVRRPRLVRPPEQGLAAWRGAVYPLLAVAVIQIAVGASVFLRTDRQLARLQAQLQEAPMAFKAEEAKRMQTVMENFHLFRLVEVVLLAVGALLMIGLRGDPFWRSVGAGLMAQSLVLLALDSLAAARGAEYLQAIAGFTRS